MHHELAKAAKAAGFSISEEIERRLNEWRSLQKTKEDIEKLHAASKAQLDVNRIKAIRQAGFQLVRDAGGNVTIHVSPELLLAEADGILRSGFVAEENIDKLPHELMIKRVIKDEVESAIEKALMKVGLLGRKGVA